MSRIHQLADLRRALKLYRFEHALARCRDAVASRSIGATEICYVVAPQNRDWILNRIGMELAAASPNGRVVVAADVRRLPPARVYFFTHVSLFMRHFGWRGRSAVRAVFVTHISDQVFDEVASGLRGADAVFCMNSQTIEALRAAGVPASRLRLAIGGVDVGAFERHQEVKPRRVILNSAFYPRKNPEKLAALVRALPAERFLLIGRNWPDWPGFESLRASMNFEYIEADYAEYPALYLRGDVFLSLSRLEGGPIPLLEAMSADLVPIATRTGFAPDVIDHGSNGFLCDCDAPVEEIAALLDEARSRPRQVRETVLCYSWSAFSARVNDTLASLPSAGL